MVGLFECLKIAILASIITGKNVDAEKIYTEGITGITKNDFEFASAAGMTIKLLAKARLQEDGSVLAMVAPHMLSKEHSLSMVNDVFNAIFVTGNMLGDTMFYGHGAGKLPTASAVAADVIECIRNQGRTVQNVWENTDNVLVDVSQTRKKFYVRVKGLEHGRIDEVFPGNSKIKATGHEEETGFFTQEMSEQEFYEKCALLKENILNTIRVL